MPRAIETVARRHVVVTYCAAHQVRSGEVLVLDGTGFAPVTIPSSRWEMQLDAGTYAMYVHLLHNMMLQQSQATGGGQAAGPIACFWEAAGTTRSTCRT